MFQFIVICYLEVNINSEMSMLVDNNTDVGQDDENDEDGDHQAEEQQHSEVVHHGHHDHYHNCRPCK